MVDPVMAAGAAAVGAGAVGALAAVSAPLTKLVETVSAGLGRMYEPTHIRRLARAEGEKLVILAKASTEVTEVQQRAAERWLAVEGRRQLNIEAIADKAAKELPDSVNERPVDGGWAAKFFDECKDVSDEDMQSLWARLLAGEVANPGSYSIRTMRVLAGLSPAEASKFSVLCSFVVHGATTSPFFMRERESFFSERGLHFATMQELEAAGLVQRESPGLVLRGLKGPLSLFPCGDGPALVGRRPLLLDVPCDVELGTVSLTRAGLELVQLWRGSADVEHLQWLQTKFTHGGWATDLVPLVLTETGHRRYQFPAWWDEYWAARSSPKPTA